VCLLPFSKKILKKKQKVRAGQYKTIIVYKEEMASSSIYALQEKLRQDSGSFQQLQHGKLL